MTPTDPLPATVSDPGRAAVEPPVVYWHRQLPPLDAEMIGEHVLEATSGRVQGTLAHRDELWDRCYRSLIANTEERFAQEVARLGGHYAHVLNVANDPALIGSYACQALCGDLWRLYLGNPAPLTLTP